MQRVLKVWFSRADEGEVSRWNGQQAEVGGNTVKGWRRRRLPTSSTDLSTWALCTDHTLKESGSKPRFTGYSEFCLYQFLVQALEKSEVQAKQRSLAPQ